MVSRRSLPGSRADGYPRLVGKRAGDTPKGLAVVGALAGAGLLVGLVSYFFLIPTVRPDTVGLRSFVLTGTRATPSPVCLDLAVDVSPSMSSKVPIRDKAVAQLQEFVNRNANGEDVLASVAFSSQAVVTVIPTHVRQLQPGALARPASNLMSSGTLLAPALQQLHKSYSHSSVKCHAHSLVVVTDAEIYDPPQAVLNGFKDLGLKKVYFALPNQDDGARPGIAPALPAVITRGFRGPNGLSLTYGQALADLTGQKLVQVPKGATPTQHSPS